MVMNHHLLNAVGVGHPALTAVVEAAATAGAAGKGEGEGEGSFPGFACKLTGAGGGGCAIILSPVPYAPSFPGATTSTQEQSPLAATGAVERALDSLVDKLR